MTPDPLAPPTRPPTRRLLRVVWQGRLMPAFWTVTAILSLSVNLVLIVALILMGQQLFTLKRVVSTILQDLHQNFVLMDQARIQTTVEVDDSIPVRFNLPVETTTVVTLSDPVRIPNATVLRLQTGGLNITNAPADILLPAGTPLSIRLSIVVPVDQQVPVHLTVPVDIPLQETQLHQPFVGLQEVVGPLVGLLGKTPNAWEEFLCPPAPDALCQYLDRRRTLPDLLSIP